MPTYLQNDPLTRTPLVKAVRNSHIFGFAIVSDGVAKPNLPYTKEPLIESLLFNERKTFSECFKAAAILACPPKTDDRSGFLCWFGHSGAEGKSSASHATKKSKGYTK